MTADQTTPPAVPARDPVEHISLVPADDTGELLIDLARDEHGAPDAVVIEVYAYGDDANPDADAQLYLGLDEAHRLHTRLTALLLRAEGTLTDTDPTGASS